MDFNILDAEINIPSKDPRDYTVFISGKPGCGKTSLVKQMPKSFTIDLDRGTKTHAMKAQVAKDWYEVIEIRDQLVQMAKMKKKATKAKENGDNEVDIKVAKKKLTLPVDKAIEVTSKIEFVSIDTVNQAKQFAKDYMINKYNEKRISESKNEITNFNEIGWGKDDELESMLMDLINSLIDAGYGVAEVSHIKDKKINKDTEDERIQVVPDLLDSERNYLVGAADIEIQIVIEDKTIEKAKKNEDKKLLKSAVVEQETWMYLRANADKEAKSRFAFLPEKIPYGYDNLVKAIEEAVDKEIEYGKNIYNLNDNDVEELIQKQDQQKEDKNDEDINIIKLEDLIEIIKTKYNSLDKMVDDDGNKKYLRKDLNSIIGKVNYKTIEEAEQVLQNLNKVG